jgi:predicted molibdopterin-dependent oxidoreductase YjgC
MKTKWGIKKLPGTVTASQYEALEKGLLKNLFIFGEDPLGCAQNKVKVAGWLSVADFVMVQDYFMTQTAEKADLVLPASFPVETGGSFTNTQKVIQEYEAVIGQKVEKTSLQQLIDLSAKFGLNGLETVKDVMMEAISLLPEKTTKEKQIFNHTDNCNCSRMFNYGCDTIVKRFEEHFVSSLKN